MNKISLAVAPLQTFFGDTPLGSATSFIIEKSGRYFLVTNRHVVSGKNNENGTTLHPQGALPNRVLVKIPTLIQKDGEQIVAWLEMEKKYENEKIGESWWEHDDLKIDIALFEISPNEHKIMGINQCDLAIFNVDVTDSIYIVGYPAGLSGHKYWPLYKGGTVASEPSIDHDGLPRIIIDAATYSGMSGAPVVARIDTIIPTGINGAMSDDDYFGAHFTFLGVYSSRFNDKIDGGTTQLGIVWKKKCIDEIIEKALRFEPATKT